MRCCLKKCGSNNEGKACEISFFQFPKDAKLLKQWLCFCGREYNFNPKTAHLCMKHFKASDFENILKYEMGFAKKRRLKSGAVPTIFNASAENCAFDEDRVVGHQRHENKVIDQTLTQEDNVLNVELEPHTLDHDYSESPLMPNDTSPLIVWTSSENSDFLADQAVQPPLRSKYTQMQLWESLQKEYESLREDNISLQKTQKENDRDLRTLAQKYEPAKNQHLNQIHLLKQRLAKAELAKKNMTAKLRTIFTSGQITLMSNGIRGSTWNDEDVDNAFDLYAANAEAYTFLFEKGFPLPAIHPVQQ